MRARSTWHSIAKLNNIARSCLDQLTFNLILIFFHEILVNLRLIYILPEKINPIMLPLFVLISLSLSLVLVIIESQLVVGQAQAKVKN